MSLIIEDITFHEKPIERMVKVLMLNAKAKKMIGAQFKLLESNDENC